MKEVIYIYVKGQGWVPERESDTKDWSHKEWDEWYKIRTSWRIPRSIMYADNI